MTNPPTSPASQPHPTTDNPDELFDLVDEQDHVIGQVRRGDAHRNPALLHRSVQIMVFDSAGRLLLQHRSSRKDLFPGYYCASASGHVIAGDDYLATAQRELAEELGITAPLTPLGHALVHSAVETEMTALFLAHSDGPFHFDPVETAGGELLTWQDALAARATLLMTPALLVALAALERLLASGALTLPL
jgi:isopentenyl-diphosphate Delta-isomerase